MSEKTSHERVSQEVFIQTFVACNGDAVKVAEKLNLEVESVQARASQYRSEGIPLPTSRKGGGGRKRDIEAGLAMLAKATGRPIEELRAEGETAKAKSKARKEKRAAEKAQTQTASA